MKVAFRPVCGYNKDMRKQEREAAVITTIIFDIGRVLVGFEWGDYARSLFGEVTAREITAAMWDSGHWFELDLANLTDDEILELFYRERPAYRAEIREAFERVGECVTRRDWVIPYIHELQARGYRVLFLSNYSEHVMNANREALDFLQHLDGGVFSCDVHLVKPDPAIYRTLMNQYGLTPEECLFIDDRKRNTDAAQALGMHAIVFENYEQMRSDIERECRG